LSQFRSRIEIYTPAERRQHNHYMLPFLLDAYLVASVERQSGRLLMQAMRLEQRARSHKTGEPSHLPRGLQVT